MKGLVVAIAIIAVLVQRSLATFETFDEDKLRYVYGNKMNLLYRSNNPLYYDDLQQLQFDYHGVIKAMKHNTSPFPQNFSLVIISLLDPHIKHDNVTIRIEQRFVNDRHDPNRECNDVLINWPLHGCLTEGCHSPDEGVVDQLHHRVALINSLLNDVNVWNKCNNVILVHCMEGIDRTGEMIGAFKLQQQYDWYHSRSNSTELARIMRGELCQYVVDNTRIACKPAPKPHNYEAIVQYMKYLLSK
jgi:hypothetical protein